MGYAVRKLTRGHRALDARLDYDQSGANAYWVHRFSSLSPLPVNDVRIPSGGEYRLQAHGRVTGIVARWRQIRLTTSTPSMLRISAKIADCGGFRAAACGLFGFRAVFDVIASGDEDVVSADRAAAIRTKPGPSASPGRAVVRPVRQHSAASAAWRCVP
jgi:hypothetical protein